MVKLDFGSLGLARKAFLEFSLLDLTYFRVGKHMLLYFNADIR
jgi:hypothetical protein